MREWSAHGGNGGDRVGTVGEGGKLLGRRWEGEMDWDVVLRHCFCGVEVDDSVDDGDQHSGTKS